MQLRQLVETSLAVGRTRSRKQKIAALAETVAKLEGDEIEIGVGYLAGQLRQGRLGVGPAALRRAQEGVAARAEPRLTVTEVDQRLSAVAASRAT